MVVFLPIIIPHQPSCFALFCVVGCVVAIDDGVTSECQSFNDVYSCTRARAAVLLVMALKLLL